MTLAIKIRNAVPSDIEDMIRLLEQLFTIEKDFTFDEDCHRKGLLLMMEGCGKHKTLKVAEHNQKIIGMCSIQTRISTATGGVSGFIEDLVVDKHHRGNGVGKALLDHMNRWAQQRGIQSLQLLADKHNTPALDFYHRLNWQTTQLICLTKKI
ncbi:MAG: GNAT family N-acetyltransferase [Proteobacteria bacterium]|nr:GNAT family N-acetyltransferase [Pseudomonadota bacterium]MBU1388125.1 GNAT family N-acetyltransferase [Pseudomonadota bacterium]MBU1542189.1 GNAT family N-acetyltransferase [Pseudomonadota bacterium]MBU2481655.1 GNAT family N-acetyltransferase [Pseudomonadota bacterium]